MKVCALLVSLSLTTLAVVPAAAQQVTGTPGAPDATTTIDGKQLPPPDPKFGGVIKDDALQSTPWWAPRVVPPKDAPNVRLIITDDAGFGVPSTFGGVIPTPTMDRIANEGLRYNRVFSTALCSPTRAALITGRNHHSAGFGVISEQSTGFPGYNSIIGKDKATIGRILLDNGYGMVRQGSQHASVRRQPGRAVRPVAEFYAPIWGYVYDSTVHDLSKTASLPLAGFAEPRIEPEIVFGLASAPAPDMDETALLSCVDWVAHGFEIVQSIFPQWQFSAADTVAANGVHGALLIGPRHTIELCVAEWEKALSTFEIDLLCDGRVIDRGHSANVLDGPVSALRAARQSG